MSKDRVPPRKPSSTKPPARTKTQEPAGGIRPLLPKDLPWLEYVSSLSPQDEAGAFLLPGELPNGRTPANQVLTAIRTATRRAFGGRGSLHITDFCLGRIWGEMRVLLPQGRDVVFSFDGELGWKATVIQGEEPNTRVMTAYYRYACMNPVRSAAALGAELDSSQVTFIPLDTAETEEIIDTPFYIRLFDESRDRLAYEYKLLQRAGQLLSTPDQHRGAVGPSHPQEAWLQPLRERLAASPAGETGSILLEWLNSLIFPEEKDQ